MGFYLFPASDKSKNSSAAQGTSGISHLAAVTT